MELNQTPAIRQQTVLAPQLYQGLKILQLNAAELKKLVQHELDENPLLEIPDNYSTTAEPDPGFAERDMWRELAGANRNRRCNGERGLSRTDAAELTASPKTLSDHLSIQLELQDMTAAQKKIGMAIIYSLDSDGYLREPLAEIAAVTGGTVEEVDTVLAQVQHFDPPGIAARDLQECLLNQMDQKDAEGLAGRIAQSYLQQIGRGSLAEVARSLSVSIARVERAVELIRSLCPAPGAIFDTSPPSGAVIPDVYIRKTDEGLAVLANREVTPCIKISRIYDSIPGSADADLAAREFIAKKIESARQLIKDIDRRRLTVSSVARAIADAQPEFFSSGPDHIRPMKLDDIAAALDVNPSTVSRAIQGKFMSTPFGIFEFKYFFSCGYSSTAGPELAATAIKRRLGRLIAEEDRRHPLSDQKLADSLREESIKISRRTVAKYREELCIPASSQRKQR